MRQTSDFAVSEDLFQTSKPMNVWHEKCEQSYYFFIWLCRSTIILLLHSSRVDLLWNCVFLHLTLLTVTSLFTDTFQNLRLSRCLDNDIIIIIQQVFTPVKDTRLFNSSIYFTLILNILLNVSLFIFSFGHLSLSSSITERERKMRKTRERNIILGILRLQVYNFLNR